jgi:hypothetical protein
MNPSVAQSTKGTHVSTSWKIVAADGTTEAEEMAVRTDGSLLLLRQVGQARRRALTPVFALANGVWRSAWIVDVDWETPDPVRAEEPVPEPRILEQADDIPDLLGDRRRVVEARLAEVDTHGKPA